jgi:predicted CoA-binding protein
MNTRKEVEEFIAQKSLAVVGLSRDPNAFSSSVSRELKERGYRLLAVNPKADEIGGEKCYPDVASLPEKVGGAIFFTPKPETVKVVREAAAAGIRRIWLQQGAESPEAVRFCADNGLSVVSGQCILMFLEPVAVYHKIHRWFKGLFGGLPK